MQVEMVDAYVERLLEGIIGGPVKRDNGGDYPMRYQGALYYVRVVGENDPSMQVFSVAVADVEPTPELFAALNGLNSRIRFARAFWVAIQILIETEILGAALNRDGFNNACRTVAVITDDVAPDLAKEFGGRTAFQDEQSESYEPAGPDLVGQYL